MGTKFTPTYANIFMGIFEETHIYTLTKQNVQLYLKYIDDIFFIWTGSEDKLFTLSRRLRRLRSSNLIFTENHSTLKLLNEAFPIHKR